MLYALFGIVDMILQLMVWVIIIQAVLSWLVAFNVINTQSNFVVDPAQRARPGHRAALPADPAIVARFRRDRFFADRADPGDPGRAQAGRRARAGDQRDLDVTARIIDGKAVAAALRGRVANAAAAFAETIGRVPGLAVVLVGDDPASSVYVRSKGKATLEAGMAELLHPLPADTSEADLLALVERLNLDPGGRRNPRPIAAAAADRCRQSACGDRPGQGRRRFPCRECRAARRWRRGAGAVHPAWLPPSAQDRTGRPDRARRGGDRAVEHRRQADGDAVAGRKRDGDYRP